MMYRVVERDSGFVQMNADGNTRSCIMKMLTLIGVFVLVSVMPVMAITASGTITEDEIWSDTVLVTGDVVVENGTLTIEPGSVVKFETTNDNIVYGSSLRCNLVALDSGAIQAIGTAEKRIVFTVAGTSTYPGQWRGVHIIANDDRSDFAFCDFNYASSGCVLENPEGVTGASQITIDNCRFNTLSSSAVYCANGGSITVTNSHAIKCKRAIFAYGAAEVWISHCTVDKCHEGFIIAGLDSVVSDVSIDHVTIANCDLSAASQLDWFAGYSIYYAFVGYSSEIKNSILYQATLANLKVSDWTVNEHHNCMNTGMMGLANYEDGVIDSTTTEEDAQFVDRENGDFSLQAGSPCTGTADDGTNIGAWQAGDVWPWEGIVGIGTAPAVRSRAGYTSQQDGVVFDVRGAQVDSKQLKYGIYLQVGPGGVLRKRMVLE